MSQQKLATIVSSATALFLIVVKLMVGISTGTVVIIASAIDSALDFIVSLFNYFAVTKSQKPTDEHYNYGRGKIEGMAGVFEGLIIAISGGFIIYAAVLKLLHSEPTQQLGWSLAVMFISLAATGALVVFLNRIYKKTRSLVVKSDALHYKTDLYTNVGIIVSLVAIYFTGWNFIDPLVSVGIAVYIIISAYAIVREGANMLLDRALDDEKVFAIVEIIDRHVQDHDCIISGYHDLKTRQSANINFVDVHLVFNDRVLLRESHALSDHIEDYIRELDSGAKWVINIHQDPYDDAINKARF